MSRAWLIGGAVVVGALMLLGIVVSLTRREAELDEGTPERAVQEFLVAIRDEDFKLAHGFYSKGLKEDCSLEALAARSFGSAQQLAESRVTFERTSYLNGSAVVVTRVTTVSDRGLFGPSEYSREERFSLVQEEGEWRFSTGPWPYFGCARFLGPPEEPYVPAPLPSPIPSPVSTTSAPETRP